MSESAVSSRFRLSGHRADVVTVASYAILGSILCWTRFTGLDRSYWHDEIVTVRDFVAAGPHAILIGHYFPNNHELFSLLAWATTSLIGESEIALRLWSVIPFILGVIVVSAWLHIRVSPLSGVFFLFLATVAPLLLDLSRQARGYGLAFLAMSVLIVAALEADRSGRTWTIVAFCAAGLVGTWTLPNFGIAFLATGAILLTNSRVRVRTTVGLAASILALAAWYAPNFDELAESSRQVFGTPIDTVGVVTAPFDRILLPGLLWIDGRVPVSSFLWLPITVMVLLPISASPLLRRRGPALILGSGVVGTVVVLWATETRAVPRFLSFLLVPLLMFLASGLASIVARLTTRPPLVRTVVALTTLVLLIVASAPHIAQVMRLPREAHKDAVATIRDQAPASAPVFTYMLQPGDLAFYLNHPVLKIRTPAGISRVCNRREEAVLVVHSWRLAPVSIPCAQRPGTRHYRFEQYARGGEMSVWFIAPAR